MFTFNCAHGLLKICKFRFHPECARQLFDSTTMRVKWLHSLNHAKKNKPIYQIYKKRQKNSKPNLKKDLEPKVYMRDTIAKISNILRYSTWDSAQEQLDQLSIRWDSYTVNQVLKTHPPMEKAWLFFNWASNLTKFKHDQFTCTTMLDIFGEAGRISSMKYLFKQIQAKGVTVDVVTYTSLLHWLSKDGDINGSVNLWNEMKANGCFPTVVSYTAYMKVLFDHGRVKEATEIYKEMIHEGLSPNCYTYTILMEYLAGCGNFTEVLEIFVKMQEARVLPDKATCNILIEKCCVSGETRAMTPILQYMKNNSLVLREPIYQEALKILNDAGQCDILLREANPHFSIGHTIKSENIGVKPRCEDSHFNIDRGLTFMFFNRRNFTAMNRLLAGLIEKGYHFDPSTISTIIEVYCAHSQIDSAILAYEYSVKLRINIDKTAYLALIGALIRTSISTKIVEIVKQLRKDGFSLGTYLSALLVCRLGNARRPVCSANIFDMLPDDEKNCATFTALIAAFFNVGSFDKGIEIYKSMQTRGVKPVLGTYNVLLDGLQKAGRVAEVEKYSKEKKILQTGVSMEENICNLLFCG